jgi:uncharacterized protein involved in propanediol utilization
VEPDGTCTDTADLVPGTLSLAKFFTTQITTGTLASGTTFPVTGGTHKYTVCAASAIEATVLIEASLTALWVPEGSATVASLGGLDVPVPSLEELLSSDD